MNIYEIDPTTDPRWEEFLQSHPQASIFHTGGWLEALRRTYGYTPVVFTTSPAGCPLTSGIPFCKISGWFRRRRLVALPFSDHCDPLVQTPEQLQSLIDYVREKCNAEGWDYAEVRPTQDELDAVSTFGRSQSYCLHRLDIRRSLTDIFQNVHKSCVQRKIRRSVREGLTYEEGTGDTLLERFYGLLVLTRRRHGLPTQPLCWFQNLIACLSGNLKIRLASKGERPVASILTIRYKRVLVYKYGGSDRRFSNTGGMQFLLWRAIQEAKNDNLWELDLGRSDADNLGLIAFKNRWGAAKTDLAYFRYPVMSADLLAKASQGPISKYVWSHAPDTLVTAASEALYKHLG